MSKEQLDLIDLIVKERKKIESLKEELRQVQKDYYNNLLKLCNNIDILGKEKGMTNAEIIPMQDYKTKKLSKSKLIDKD